MGTLAQYERFKRHELIDLQQPFVTKADVNLFIRHGPTPYGKMMDTMQSIPTYTAAFTLISCGLLAGYGIYRKQTPKTSALTALAVSPIMYWFHNEFTLHWTHKRLIDEEETKWVFYKWNQTVSNNMETFPEKSKLDAIQDLKPHYDNLIPFWLEPQPSTSKMIFEQFSVAQWERDQSSKHQPSSSAASPASSKNSI